MRGLYSPIDKLAAELPRTKGTGAEFMTELSKRPGYKPQEAEDRNLQTLMALPKMERAKFLDQLKMKPVPQLEETTHANSILRNRGLNVDPDTPTKYEEHTLPGGSNYREILMHMPAHEGQHHKFNYPATLHWDKPAVLAHVRAKDRVGPNGEKLLHIEEIQSDWHQQGREHGYANPESLKEFQAAELQHKGLRRQLEEAKSKSEYAEHSLGRKEPLFQQPDVRARFEAAKIRHNNEIMDLMPQVMKAQALEQDLQNKLRTAVPDAPFKKNWHELALKKMIHHAAENGYHGIVITPGQEQADRYKLSKHVGMVSYHPEQQRFQAFKPNRETVINETGATPERVAELIGKDVADRLMKAPKVGDHHYLEGEDINIGGEGMKGFYDKMLPSFLNQFGKKYGAKVGQMQMPVEAGIEPGWITKPAAPRNVAVHHFPITPEMREDVTKNGLPLYADGGSARDENLQHFLKDSKVKSRVYHGTMSDVKEFKTPAYFGSKEVANQFADPEYMFGSDKLNKGEHPNVIPVHLNLKNPKVFTNEDEYEKHVMEGGLDANHWIKKGYDSVIYAPHGDIKHPDAYYVAFHPHQIKSAIGNRGTYDPNDPDITKAEGGRVPHLAIGGQEPKKTVKAYKLFRVHPKHPGKLFPLFVDANTPVEMGKWIAAKEGEMANGKVKSKIGPLAYRPGWHAGDLPVATHIGEKSDPALTAPDVRPENHAWAEVELPHDVDWQSVANERGVNKQGRLIPSRAHITDQIPVGGHYRYKTNPNMTGNWLIGGAMKVNRMLSDKEVAKINKAAGAADLPRQKPFNFKKFGFANGGTVGPEEWMAEEHVNHRAKPVGYTKEKVTVSPNLDQMRYELISVKHSKKVK